jgi:hypothetical protein
MHVDHLFLRLDGRVFEVLSDQSGYAQRVHVDALGFAAKGPDRHGGYTVMIGLLREGEIHRGAGVTKLDLDAGQFARFEELVAAAKAARDAGPDAW